MPASVPPICLIRPPTFANFSSLGQDATPPLGLAYLASSLKLAGFHVIGVDAIGEAPQQYTRLPGISDGLLHGLGADEIVERIPADTCAIGVSCMFSVEWPFVYPVLECIRARFPKVFIVVGGEHVTACPEYILNTCPAVDVCVLGEGEGTLVRLLEAHFSKQPLQDVEGLCIRCGDGPLRTAVRARIQDINTVPVPDWDIFPIETYIDLGLTYGANLGRCMPLMVSRGCPYECTFCSSPSMWTRKWNVRSPAGVIAEMKRYKHKYRVVNFDFYDLTAVIRRDWIIEFCDLLVKEKMNITWQMPSGTRSEAIDEEVSAKLYSSGCRLMNYAPESGSVPELKRVKKRVNLDNMVSSMKSAEKNGIHVKCNFIFGMPGAGWPDVFRTYGFISLIAFAGAHDISAFPFSPYPGTELFRSLENSGKVCLNDKYFRSLSAFTDLLHGRSFNERFGSQNSFRHLFVRHGIFLFSQRLVSPDPVHAIDPSVYCSRYFVEVHFCPFPCGQKGQGEKKIICLGKGKSARCSRKERYPAH